MVMHLRPPYRLSGSSISRDFKDTTISKTIDQRVEFIYAAGNVRVVVESSLELLHIQLVPSNTAGGCVLSNQRDVCLEVRKANHAGW